MIQFTTKQLLQILPMDENIRTEVLANFDNLSEDQKLAIKKFCWTMFFELYNNKVQLEFQNALLAVKDKKRGLKPNLYQEIQGQVLNELKEALLQKAEKSAVQKVQTELQKHFRKPQENPPQA